MFSLNEISKICGVSLATTSKALNGKAGVNEVTRQRILSVARQHNYRPNRLVHAIQQGKSMTVGITCNHFRDEFMGAVVDGMLSTLYAAKYDALVISWDMCVEKGEHVLRTLAERRVDGLLMCPPAALPSAAYLQELREFGGPVVTIDQEFSGGEYDFVGSQDREGACELTEHLIALGHRKIGCLSHRKVGSGRERFEGYQQAMMRAGLAMHEKWMLDIPTHESEDAYRGASELLSSADRPTAIVAFNDYFAMQTLAAAQDLGLQVPGDVSVAGFADLNFSSFLRPRLTTVAQDPHEIGRVAASSLLAKIDRAKVSIEEPAPAKKLLPVRLVTRESTGPAPATES